MTQKFTGTITRWQDDKGFGFIETENATKELFFHISDYRAKDRPILQENVVFELGTDKKGQPCAKNVQQASFVQQRQQLPKNQKSANRQVKQTHELGINVTLIFGGVFLLVLVGLLFTKVLPVWVIGWYVAINIATFAMYAHDKHSAQNNTWRVQESSLHKLSLLGGWVGAGIAHKTLRHKSQKAKFRHAFYLTIVVNLVLLSVFLYNK